MWQLVQVVTEGQDETMGEYDTEERALDAAHQAANDLAVLYVVRQDGEDVWTNETGQFERI